VWSGAVSTLVDTIRLIPSILDRMIGTNRCWGVTRTEVVAADWSMFLFEFKTSCFMG
jgi:hypothetical protein